jgi:hypothetical protein
MELFAKYGNIFMRGLVNDLQDLDVFVSTVPTSLPQCDGVPGNNVLHSI